MSRLFISQRPSNPANSTKHLLRQPNPCVYTLSKRINISPMKKTLIFFSLSLFVIISCSKSDDTPPPANECSSSPKSFSADVNPIIQSSCAANAGCHGAGSVNGPGPLLTYTHIFNARSIVKAAVANGSMPKNGSLTNAQKTAIICWVDNGALNN